MIRERLRGLFEREPIKVQGALISYQLDCTLERKGMARVQVRVDGIHDQALPNIEVQRLLFSLGLDPEVAQGLVQRQDLETIVEVTIPPSKKPKNSTIELVGLKEIA